MPNVQKPKSLPQNMKLKPVLLTRDQRKIISNALHWYKESIKNTLIVSIQYSWVDVAILEEKFF